MLRYAEWEPIGQEGDPLADAVAAELLDTGQVGHVNELFRLFDSVDDAPPEGCPPILADYLRATARFPDWMDSARLGHVAEFYRHHASAAIAVQGTAGLVGTYLSPMGARTLHSTHRLDRPQRRLSESTRLFIGMGEADAFDPSCSKLATTCQKVRLVHAAIRQLHLRRGWDVDTDGMPVSQRYMVAAALVFSIGMIDAFARLGIRLSAAERDGCYYAWLVTANLLGVPDGYLPADTDDAIALWHEARPGEWLPSEPGAILTRGALQLYDESLPDGLAAAFLRRALGGAYADMVAVPRQPLWDGLVWAGSRALAVVTGARMAAVARPVLRRLSSAVMLGNRPRLASAATEPQMSDHIDG